MSAVRKQARKTCKRYTLAAGTCYAFCFHAGGTLLQSERIASVIVFILWSFVHSSDMYIYTQTPLRFLLQLVAVVSLVVCSHTYLTHPHPRHTLTKADATACRSWSLVQLLGLQGRCCWSLRQRQVRNTIPHTSICLHILRRVMPRFRKRFATYTPHIFKVCNHKEGHAKEEPFISMSPTTSLHELNYIISMD